MTAFSSLIKARIPERFEVLKHSGYLLLARLFARVASAPFLIFAAVKLGPSLFGVFSFTLATVEMLSALGDFGLSRYGARALVREEAGKARLAGIILALQLLASVVLTVLALAGLALLAPEPTKRDVLLLGLAAAFLSSFVFTTDTIFTAFKSFGASAILSVIGRIVYLITGFAALMLGYSVVAVMTAFLLGMAVESLLRMIYTAARLTPFSFRFSAGELWRVAVDTLPFTITAVATLVYFRADTLILELLKGDVAVGIYGAAYSFFSFFVWVPIILTRTLLPGFTRRFAEEPEAAERASWSWYRIVGIVGVPMAFAMTMLAGPVIDLLMPSAYAGSVIALQILMWSIPTLMMTSVGFNALVVTNHEREGARATVITAAVIVALDFLLIPFLDVRGAAIAMVISTALWLAHVHWLLKSRVWAPGHGLAGAFGIPLAGGAIMAAAALAASPLGLWPALAAGLAGYGAASAAALLLPKRR